MVPPFGHGSRIVVMAYEEDIGAEGDDERAEDISQQIDEVERDALRRDLIDVRTLKAVLESKGIRGVIVWCPDCEADHFLGWDLLANNLQQILDEGEPPVHEPAWNPDPDEYVTWDYARGYLDGFENLAEGARAAECGYCSAPLAQDQNIKYCPSCGHAVAPLNLTIQLKKEGWTQEAIDKLLLNAGFELPIPGSEGSADPPDPSGPPSLSDPSE
jgi:hypothetical protein